MNEIDYSRAMLSKMRQVIREHKQAEMPSEQTLNEKDNMFRRMGILMEEAVSDSKKKLNEDSEPEQPKEKPFVIKKSDVQFGSVRSSQEDAIRKTVGDVKLKDDALKYYPNLQDIVVNGEINAVGVTFQFRYKDPSGDGCYIWGEGLQLTDSNLKTIEKIRDAFLNWKQSIVEDGDLMDKLYKESMKNK